MKFRIATVLVFAIATAAASYAADAKAPGLNVLGSVKVMASPGDSIIKAKDHNHEYVYIVHARDKAIDIIDVSNPAAPRQVNGSEARLPRRAQQTAVFSMADSSTTGTARILDLSDPNEPRTVAEFPNAISVTSDHQMIYVLDENSLRIISTTQQKQKQPQEDDSWFWNAMTPG